MKELYASLETSPEPPLPSEVKRLLVIHNPIAGRRRRHRYAAYLEALRAHGLLLEELPTTCRGDAERQARDIACGPGDMIVAAGGDGTINEVVNGLMHNRQVGRDRPLAILPLGTANVLAAEIGLRRDLDSIVDYITKGRPRRIALGRVGERYFITMAGVGFDAHVVAAVDEMLKRRLGKLAYVTRLLQQLRTYDFPTYQAIIEGRNFPASSIIVTNGRFYAGRLLLAPEASLEEEALKVILFQRKGVWHALKYAAALLFGLLPRLSDVRQLSAQRLRLEGPPGDPLQADGDLVGQLPANVELVPAALPLLMPHAPR